VICAKRFIAQRDVANFAIPTDLSTDRPIFFWLPMLYFSFLFSYVVSALEGSPKSHNFNICFHICFNLLSSLLSFKKENVLGINGGTFL
jgi:hypothetical protein